MDGFFAVFIDDSRESSARRAARDSQRNAQALLDAVPDASFLMEADGGLLACNTAATMGLDMAPGKILGRNLYDILPSHEADLTREMVAEAGRGKRAVRFLNLFEGRIFDHSLCPILNEEGEVARLAVFQRDITDRKRAEEELKKAEREYRGIFEHAPVGIFKSSRDGRYVSINAFGAEMFGYDSPAEMIQAITDIGTQVYADPADRAKVLGKLRKDGRVRNFECGMKRKDGSVVSVSFHGKPIFGKDGGISFIEGFVTDITDRKRAEEELKSALHSTAREVEKRTVELWDANESLRREVEERTRVEEEVRKSKMLLEKTFASLRDAVFIVDAVTTRVMDCNSAVTEMFGYRPEEVIGESTAHLHASPKSLDQFRGYLEYAVEKVGYLQLDDFTMRRKSGELFPTEHTVTPLVDEQGVRFAWVSIVKDTTYRKETEETLATRLRYEQALAECSKALLSGEEARKAFTGALGALLQAVKADRVYIFENIDCAEHGLCCRQAFEVCADGVAPQADNPALLHAPYSQGMDWLRTELSKDCPVFGEVESFPEPLRAVLKEQEILSILILPIFIGKTWYGFIGFDDTARTRGWKQEDVLLLTTAAEMFGAAFHRYASEQALRESGSD